MGPPSIFYGNPGNRVRGGLPGGRLGSIPACAGEPPACPPLSWPSTVYPRVCGGTSRLARYSWGFIGLSPRVRGNQHIGDYLGQGTGSIPACAGEPRSSGRRVPATGVYPRVCGGTVEVPQVELLVVGLSPRVRGNPTGRVRPGPDQRSIPACAGEP